MQNNMDFTGAFANIRTTGIKNPNLPTQFQDAECIDLINDDCSYIDETISRTLGLNPIAMGVHQIFVFNIQNNATLTEVQIRDAGVSIKLEVFEIPKLKALTGADIMLGKKARKILNSVV